MGSRADMRENGAGAARQDRREQVPLTLELAMANGEDTATEAKKALGSNALFDPCVANAHGEQLCACHHAVLPPGNGRQAPIHRGLVAFSFHLKA
jgi:hypothetical protein